MKKIIKKTKEQLEREVNRLRRIIKTLVGLVITIALVFPWSAVFLGAKVGIWLGIVSTIVSLCFVKYLKDKKII